MTLQEFKSSLQRTTPPQKISGPLQALWYDAKGDWETSHAIAQDIHTPDGSWVHAYLHRKEGDLGNASYWYQRAGKPLPSVSLEKEWDAIVTEFLKS